MRFRRPSSPPNLYRLLGLQKYEPDPEVIEYAADRQMLFLRGFRSSARGPYAEALLSAVARAKVELLNPLRKQVYDRSLLQAEQDRLHQVVSVASPWMVELDEFKLVSPPQTHPPVTAATSPAAMALAELAPPPKPAAATTSAVTASAGTTPDATTPAASSPRRCSQPSNGTNWARLVGIFLGGPTGIAIGIWLANLLGLFGAAPQPGARPPANSTAQRPARTARPELWRPPTPASTFPSSAIPSSQPKVQPTRPLVQQEPKSSPVPSEEEITPVAKPAAAPVEVVPALPSSVELPATTTSSPATLFTTPANAASLEWSVRSSVALPPGSGSFLLRRANSDPQRWNILFLPEAASTDQGIPIAKLLTPTGSVQFQWTTASGDEPYQTPLANCVLEAKGGSQSRAIQLRRPLALKSLPLDLNQDESKLEFELSNPPPADALLLEVVAPPKGGSFENGAANAVPGKTVVIQFAELPGAEISVRLQQKAAEPGTFTLRVTPEFVEGPKQRYELTRPKLTEMTKRWTEMGQKATLTIKQIQARTAALKEQLEDLEGVSGNIAVMTERARQMKAVSERMKVEAERLPTHRKRLLEAEARLKAVPTVEKFLTSHDQSPISFRVVAQVGQDQVVLAEGK